MWMNQKEFNAKENQKCNVYTNKEKTFKSISYACGTDNHTLAECKYIIKSTNVEFETFRDI